MPRARLSPIVLAAALSWCLPVSAARAQSAGDDFFAYANSGWLKTTEIPAGRERWNARNEIDEVTRKRVAQLLDEARGAPPGSVARKAADFRAAYMDESAIEAMGLAPLTSALDSIGRIGDKTALTRLLGAGMPADGDPFNVGVYTSAHLLGLSVERSIHGEKNYVAFLVQGGLGLPDREYYTSADPHMQAIRVRYGEYVARMLALAGFDSAEQRAARVVALESAIAETHSTSEASANDHNADNLWTRAEFARRAPGMDWPAFFAAAGLAKQNAFIAWQPSAVVGAASLVGSQSLDAWKDYLRFHVLNDHADVLPSAFRDQAQALRAAVTGQSQTVPRVQRALEATQLAMGNAIGRMYVERFFPAEQKVRVQAIVANVAAAFARRVGAVTWMSPASKRVALAKLKALYVGIGYPEHWPDYSGLAVDPTDAVGNLHRIANRNYHDALSRLGRQVDQTEWLIEPQPAAAVLSFQQNAYDFSAALLQAPKFDPSASDAANYGAIGAIIGHDITHFVDRLGADYDVDGAMHHWWTSSDSAGFERVADPLVSQFSRYRPFPDVSINGKLTETENVADLGGLAAAFDAYRRTLGSRAADTAFVRQHDREFFIAFAQSFRSKISDGAMRAQAANNDHAPDTYRVATVRNIDAWYDAFDVRPGQRLYLEPTARVRIW
jgi:putative endopeptidase